MRKGEREGETAKGFRQLVQHAVNKHIVCQHSGTVQRAVVRRGVTLLGFKNICRHHQQCKLHFKRGRKRIIYAERNTSTEEKKQQEKEGQEPHQPHQKKPLSPQIFPLSCLRVVWCLLCTWIQIGGCVQSNQVVSGSVKHERLYIQQLRDLQ